MIGAPGEIRTPDQLVRSQLLYPAELRARVEVGLYRFLSLAEVLIFVREQISGAITLTL